MSQISDAIITGIVQGFTEFLPVSSSGHIELAKYFLEMKIDENENLLFTIILHAATALSTIVIFYKDIIDIFKGLFQFKWNEESKFALKVILSMIPAAFVGVFLEDIFDAYFAGNIRFIGAMLILTAALLYLADKAKNTTKDISFKDAVIIGISQAIAILPGISRSGATISTSVLLGNDRAKAARFSFLMVIPLIFGAMAKKMLSGEMNLDIAEADYLIAGFFAAFIAGIIACKWMINIVKKAQLKYFSIYCLIVGIASLISTFI